MRSPILLIFGVRFLLFYSLQLAVIAWDGKVFSLICGGNIFHFSFWLFIENCLDFSFAFVVRRRFLAEPAIHTHTHISGTSDRTRGSAQRGESNQPTGFASLSSFGEHEAHVVQHHHYTSTNNNQQNR